MRKAAIFIVLTFLLAVCAIPVYADGIPPLPHAFYGNVTINGNPAPSGTTIEARGEGVQTGTNNPLTVIEQGKYGSAGPLGAKLIVQGNIQEGATITFYVTNANGTAIGGTATFDSGETTKLDLSVTIAVPAPAPVGGGGGGVPAIATNLFGTTGSFSISSAGIIQKTITATSADGKLTITIPAGTRALDKNNNPLTSLTAVINTSPPPPPAGANIIGLAYNFGPDGATFSPPITLTWSYDPGALPKGVAEKDLVLAYYDATAGKWVEIPSTVNTTTHTVTASVSHFTTFAIIGAAKPAAFTLSSLAISPAQVQPDKAVNISVSVANTGGLEGSYTVVLKINGVKEAEKSVTVAAGKSENVNFTSTKKEVGKYDVAVDGQSGSFTVAAPTPTTPPPTTPPAPTTPTTPPATTPPATTPTLAPPTPPAPLPPTTNWPLIGGIIGGVIVVGLLLFFLIRKIIWWRGGG